MAPILAHLKTTRTKFLATAETVSDLRWREAPSPGSWSAAEIVAHVSTIEESIIFGMKRLLRSAPKQVPWRKRIHAPLALSKWRGHKMQTPIPLDAKRVRDKRESLAGLLLTRQATLEFIEATRGSDVSPYRFSHPFFGSLNMYEWFRMIGYHELRHAKQIRELVEIFHL